jgi:hypothetical protein
LVVDHIVDVLSCLEVLFSFVCSREIINWEMHNSLDSVSLIKLLSSWPVDVQFLHLLLALKTKNSVDAVINKSFDILIGSWIRSKVAASVTNLANGERLKEISIILINESIDELNRVSV